MVSLYLATERTSEYMPTVRISLWRAVFFIGLLGCQSSDQKTFTLRAPASSEKAALASFSSSLGDSATVALRLQKDSTFILEAGTRQAPTRRIEGKLEITEERYRLFFPDTVDRLNELITPIHSDASVIVYPDYSVALDKALTQFYVRGVLVHRDTITN